MFFGIKKVTYGTAAVDAQISSKYLYSSAPLCGGLISDGISYFPCKGNGGTVKGENYSIDWDGDKTGKPTASFGSSMKFCKVTDVLPNNLLNFVDASATITQGTHTGEGIISGITLMYEGVSDSVLLLKGQIESGGITFGMVVTEDCNFIGTNLTKGLWLLYTGEGEQYGYTSNITITTEGSLYHTIKMNRDILPIECNGFDYSFAYSRLQGIQIGDDYNSKYWLTSMLHTLTLTNINGVEGDTCKIQLSTLNKRNQITSLSILNSCLSQDSLPVSIHGIISFNGNIYQLYSVQAEGSPSSSTIQVSGYRLVENTANNTYSFAKGTLSYLDSATFSISSATITDVLTIY